MTRTARIVGTSQHEIQKQTESGLEEKKQKEGLLSPRWGRERERWYKRRWKKVAEGTLRPWQGQMHEERGNHKEG